MGYAVKQVADGAVMFIEKEMLPAVDGWKLMLASAAIALVYSKAEILLSELSQHKVAQTLGLVDTDGMIDVEKAAAALKQSINKHGKMPIKIPYLDTVFNFAEKDVDTLAEYISKA